MPLQPPNKKPLHIPWHLEATIIAAAALMAYIEARNNQWLWSILFALAALAFTLSALTRTLKK